MAKKRTKFRKKGDTTFAVFNFITIVLVVICVLVVLSQNL